jgi:flagellar L-ring protein precursor FlgH
MKKIINIMVLFPVMLFAQNFSYNASRSIFSDYKALNKGDAITVIVVESSKASNQSNLESARNGSIGVSGSASMGSTPMLPDSKGSVGTSNDFKGGGKITSEGSFTTKLSAIVDSVYPNGLLHIKGTRKLEVNGEEQSISISGLVRPIDITSSNTVFSYNISEANIVLEGSGMIDRNTSPGWLTKLFHWLF